MTLGPFSWSVAGWHAFCLSAWPWHYEARRLLASLPSGRAWVVSVARGTRAAPHLWDSRVPTTGVGCRLPDWRSSLCTAPGWEQDQRRRLRYAGPDVSPRAAPAAGTANVAPLTAGAGTALYPAV